VQNHHLFVVQENYSLKSLNTFGIEASARYFTEITSVGDLQSIITDNTYSNFKKLVLGGGSNILLTGDFEGIVIKVGVGGIEVIDENEDFYYVKAGAGENWHRFVLHCIDNGYAGIENLSLIPGNVGAAPMQNIGAYGVELQEVFHKLEAVNMNTADTIEFNKEECEFGYRNSIFKNKYKDEFLITSVTLQLRKVPEFNTSYGALEQELQGVELSIKAISDAVCAIRSRKLPNPDNIGNAGSFFKNPVIDNAFFQQICADFPNVVSFKNSESDTKIAAAWLIDQCGWKGKRNGDAGVHENHALVLVNYGNAVGNEIIDLSEQIAQSVKEKFGIDLEREVNLV